MEVFIHKQLNSVSNIVPKWQTLKKDFHEITIFQDINWLKSWWDYKSKQTNIAPYIIEIKEKNKTIGLIPLYMLTIKFAKLYFRLLKPIGSELSDYLIPILSKNYSPEKLLSIAIKKIYEDSSSWDCIQWGDVPEDSFFARFLNNYPLGESSLIKRERADACPFLPLNNNVEEFKLNLENNLLKKILSKERKLIKRGGLSFIRVLTEEEIEPVMNKFFELHIERWNRTDTPSKFRFIEEREHAILAAKNLFKSNLLYLAYLSHNDEILAIEFGMSDGKKIYLYIPAFNIKFRNFSVGNILNYYIILQACNEGYEIVDFLRGDENYKQEWGVYYKFNQKYTFFNRSIKSKLYRNILYENRFNHLYLFIQKLSHYSQKLNKFGKSVSEKHV